MKIPLLGGPYDGSEETGDPPLYVLRLPVQDVPGAAWAEYQLIMIGGEPRFQFVGLLDQDGRDLPVADMGWDQVQGVVASEAQSLHDRIPPGTFFFIVFWRHSGGDQWDVDDVSNVPAEQARKFIASYLQQRDQAS